MLRAPTSPDPLQGFHPAVATWFRRAFEAATPAQRLAWPSIRAGRPTLVAAPTGSGKTLTAFLAAIDELVRMGVDAGGALPDATMVVYVSPLKALSNDIRANLEAPLEGITRELERLGCPAPVIRTAVRTGDTAPQARQAMRKRPPHILVTTPESLYVLLGSEGGRNMLTGVRTVIVDEIHALAGNKRGCHLALSLERLDALCSRRPTRIGLSATQRPLEVVARFLVGRARAGECEVVDIGHGKRRDLDIELPPVPLEPVMANDVWERVYDRMAELASQHRTTLIFVNTRRMAERAARHLAERLGPDAVAAHHGSLSKEHRLEAEQRLKQGRLRVLVATASLELGIDIGEVDLVCQVGSPRSISALLQRVGRSGHHVGGVPKGRLFPTSRDDLVECAALLDCVRRGELDALRLPKAPLDVLAQQLVAEVASREWSEDALYEMARGAEPYADLERPAFDAVLRMLAEGYGSSRGVRAAYLHRDRVTGTVRGRRGARLTAVTSGGTIPDNADYTVLLEPQGLMIGTVNEDFAVESLAGDVFQLGNASYRILRVETGRVRVEDAHGAAPSIPFWLGEAPGRSDELSAGVSRLRADVERLLGQRGDMPGLEGATRALMERIGLNEAAARQVIEYLAHARAALGRLPTQDALVMERFFDESGGMQLVIHSPFGSRLNRAWGLALRKRFCRSFNFELQAAATEDAIVLSLSTGHSFPLDEVWRYLRSSTAERLLIQALLDAPMFTERWRWNATIALALPRYVGGRKVAPPLQRMKSDDLLAAVFPDQAACLENIVGEREIPDHPLVAQTIDDCLHDAMDADSWLALLRRIERGEIELVACDLPSPSPLAMEILSARPYAFLDDAPLEERRTQAVMARRWAAPASTDELGALDAGAIEAVAAEAWPQVRSADEMHEALMSLACLTEAEAASNPGWPDWLEELAQTGRATRLLLRRGGLWTPAERLTCMQALYPSADCHPPVAPPPGCDEAWDAEEAAVEVLRARLTGFGPLALRRIAADLLLPEAMVASALAKLETEGYVMRGRFHPRAREEEWCERHLLARIHRYTISRLRREIEPVELQHFMRFLLEWQHVAPDSRLRGPDALLPIIEQLEGYETAAGAWEAELLPTRIEGYSPDWLDELGRAGKVTWMRLVASGRAAATPVRSTPMVLLPRRHLAKWQAMVPPDWQPDFSARARRVYEALAQHGAMFFEELLEQSRLLPNELEAALGELVAAGAAHSDSFAGLRALLVPPSQRTARERRRARQGAPWHLMDHAGRWALWRRPAADASPRERRRIDPLSLEHVALALLRRYGVIFWRVLEREARWLPPWRELLPVLHRLEARGDIRGGRFVAGLAGEQFALPEAIPLLRAVRRREPAGELACVSAADPLNLTGTLLPGEKIPALTNNRVLYRDGLPAAAAVAGDIRYLVEAEPDERERLRKALVSRP